MKKWILESLVANCRRELKLHPEYEHFPHWTFLLMRNKVISVGVNRSKEPAIHYGYHIKDYKPKLHSELDAICRCNGLGEGFIAINIRLNRKKETRLAKPCDICSKMLEANRCARVYYTTEKGFNYDRVI